MSNYVWIEIIHWLPFAPNDEQLMESEMLVAVDAHLNVRIFFTSHMKTKQLEWDEMCQ